MKNLSLLTLGTVAAVALTSGPAFAESPPTSEMTYIFNTLSFLVMGFLVMFMAAGFCMLESGMVRSRSVASIATKNIALYAVAGVLYYLVGYRLMYDGVDGGYMGTFGIWSADDAAAAGGDYSAGYAAASDWFFQMVFVATAASIVSGAIAERVKMFSFMVFTVVLTGVLYPITGSWEWGAGWLDAMGFSDFAGSTLVHSVGGWAALTGAIMVGARTGRFTPEGKPVPMPASNIPLVALGTFILWLGWFGFNGGSQLALGSAADAIAISNIFVNTNGAASGGLIAAFVLTKILYKKIDATMCMNGALAGLVSITAEPLTPTMGEAVLIGAFGGILAVMAVPVLEKFKIDDVVGAVPVHLVCGIWGTMAVPITNAETSFVTQFIGVAAIGGFTIITSTILWAVIKMTMGLRISAEEETLGMDIGELGIEAYPDFVRSAR